MASDSEHHRKEVLFLIGFLLAFFVVFFITFLNIRRGTPVFGMGMPVMAENILIIILSVIGIVKVIWHIIAY